MPTYVIGDIQGCYRTLCRLLDRVRFQPAHDRLWLVGDLVNRGNGSLETLRWARDLGDGAVTVLGNHDLHLLGVAHGTRPNRASDTLDTILEAPDREELLDWLRHRPLLHLEEGNVLVHAGILPGWDVQEALRLARQAEEALRGPLYPQILQALATSPPRRWKKSLRGIPRLLAILAVFTRLRTCTPQGRMCLGFSGPPAKAPPGCLPWFQVTPRKTACLKVHFGHWAALGLHLDDGVRALDSGCVWGGTLTAARLEDGQLFQEPCAEEDLVARGP